MPSTLIRNFRYEPGTRVLSVWFVPSGKRYDYQDVPQETYDAMRNSFSKGRFFNEHIRGHFKHRLVEADG